MFSRFILRYQATKPIQLKARHKGNLIRSAIGAALRRKDKAAYELFFEGKIISLDLEGYKKDRVPAFAPESLDTKSTFLPEEMFEFAIILIGGSFTWQLFFPAFYQMFEGYGFKLAEVFAEDHFTGDRQVVAKLGRYMQTVPEFTVNDIIENYRRLEQPVSLLQVELLSPLRLFRGGQLVSQPTFADVIFACYRRLHTIYQALTLGRMPMPPEFQSLPESSLNIPSETDVKWKDWFRKQSAEDGQTMAVGGTIGTIIATHREPPYLNPFIPLLKCGEFLHIGKATTMGNGIIKLSR